MIKCKSCLCNCDPGDLINGVCDDCRGEARQKEEQSAKMRMMLHAEYEQMRLEDILKCTTT